MREAVSIWGTFFVFVCAGNYIYIYIYIYCHVSKRRSSTCFERRKQNGTDSYAYSSVTERHRQSVAWRKGGVPSALVIGFTNSGDPTASIYFGCPSWK